MPHIYKAGIDILVVSREPSQFWLLYHIYARR